ncbi:hypothetical protein [Ramlibacter sp.]|uniref:hypothetical protein n=1 Tax=Ramlibacter sp. TaxID=1917967 RepID=UPI003D143E91
MDHIPTTATAAQNLMRAAKKRRKSSGESLGAALDTTAREAGYANWKHVTVCKAATGTQSASAPALPVSIQKFLIEQRAAKPASPVLLEDLRSGLLFAMDVKNADNVVPERRDRIEEWEDARLFLAGDVWQALESAETEEGGTGSHAPAMQPEESLQRFLDEIANYRFFRYLGTAPETLDEALATVFGDFFFPPSHVWLAGKFIDMADVRGVRVDEKVVYSTSFGGSAEGAPTSVADSSRKSPQPAGAASSAPGRPFIAKLDVRKWEQGLYEYIVHEGGQDLYAEAGFNSISEALKSASDAEGDLAGFEVSYGGCVVGTYPVGVLRTIAEEVAQRAVDTAASMKWL